MKPRSIVVKIDLKGWLEGRAPTRPCRLFSTLRPRRSMALQTNLGLMPAGSIACCGPSWKPLNMP